MVHWSEDDARAYLPRLRILLASLQRAGAAGVRSRANGHATVAGSRRPGSDGGAAPDVAELVPAEEAAAELEAKGIVLRDLAQGIVDFPCRHPSGREVHLCWRQGEEDLGWWHLPDAGFAGRRPLPLPTDLPEPPSPGA
ncbi:MAG TPA: DUF2203 family protein [Acidimicrobiales bacterium]|nr:DUF2203 family protein [Acidimicrobiales bacterium]